MYMRLICMTDTRLRLKVRVLLVSTVMVTRLLLQSRTFPLLGQRLGLVASNTCAMEKRNSFMILVADTVRTHLSWNRW